MKKQGTVVRWDEARGFGFIRSSASTADVFFHVRDFKSTRANNSPQPGLAVSFEEIHVGGKGPRGMAVQALSDSTAAPRDEPGPARRPQPRERDASGRSWGAWLALTLMFAYAAVVIWGVRSHHLAWWLLAVLPLLSLFTFFAYWQDKYAAQQGRWRISEDTLHLWSLAGGWPGGWVAQQVLRHKSRKPSFQATYRATTVLHCAALAGWLWWSSR